MDIFLFLLKLTVYIAVFVGLLFALVLLSIHIIKKLFAFSDNTVWRDNSGNIENPPIKKIGRISAVIIGIIGGLYLGLTIGFKLL